MSPLQSSMPAQRWPRHRLFNAWLTYDYGMLSCLGLTALQQLQAALQDKALSGWAASQLRVY